MKPGDDVRVRWQGRKHRGEIIHKGRGEYWCRIRTDPAWDYGRVGEHLSHTIIVSVHADDIELLEDGK